MATAIITKFNLQSEIGDKLITMSAWQNSMKQATPGCKESYYIVNIVRCSILRGV